MAHYILFYDYVENVVEHRAPFREEHLGIVRSLAAQGKIVLAGAFADPVDGAAIVFDVGSTEEVESFAQTDPYVLNGIVTAYRIRPWSTVPLT